MLFTIYLLFWSRQCVRRHAFFVVCENIMRCKVFFFKSRASKSLQVLFMKSRYAINLVCFCFRLLNIKMMTIKVHINNKIDYKINKYIWFFELELALNLST